MCGRSFKTHRGLSLHLSAHSRGLLKPKADERFSIVDGSFVCSACGRSFKTKRSVAAHYSFHDSETVRKHSESGKAAWNDERRAHISKVIAKSWSDEEMRKRHMDGCARIAADPEHHRRMSEAQLKAWDDDERRKRHSRKMHEVRSTPDARQDFSKRVKNMWRNPEDRERASKRSKEMWADPEYRRRVSASIRASKGTDANRISQSKRNLRMWSEPGRRERMSDVMAKRWSDEETKRRHDEAQLRLHIKWFGDRSDVVSTLMNQSAMIGYTDSMDVRQFCEKFGISGMEVCVKWFADRLGLSFRPIEKKFNPGRSGYSALELSWGKRLSEMCDDVVAESHIYGDSRRRCDFVIGRLGIEINPSYTHMSIGDSRYPTKQVDYHYRRSRDAEANGYEIIHVWDWMDDRKTLSFTRSKLHMDERKVSAHKCDLVRISNKDAKGFCDSFHLQGGLSKGQRFRYGLVYDGQLVAVSTYGPNRFSKKDAKWEWLRYCCRDGWHIYGAAQRMQGAFMDDCGEPFVTYTDYSRSNGGMDEAMGMRFLRYTGPTLVWWNGDRAVRDTLLLRLGADRVLGTDYGPREVCGMDNHDIMVNEGFVGVYDCGSKVYICG